MRLNQPKHLTSLWEVDASLPCLSHQACPPLSPLTNPSSFPPDFSASLWQVISCCRANITGRPAGFKLKSGILPQAVTPRSLAPINSWVCVVFFFKEINHLLSSISFCAYDNMNLWWFIFRRQRNRTQTFLFLVIHFPVLVLNRLCNHTPCSKDSSFNG